MGSFVGRFGEGIGKFLGGSGECLGKALGGSGDVLGAFGEALEGIDAQIISCMSPGGV